MIRKCIEKSYSKNIQKSIKGYLLSHEDLFFEIGKCVSIIQLRKHMQNPPIFTWLYTFS